MKLKQLTRQQKAKYIKGSLGMKCPFCATGFTCATFAPTQALGDPATLEQCCHCSECDAIWMDKYKLVDIVRVPRITRNSN